MPKEKSYPLDNILPAGSYLYSSGMYLYSPRIIQQLLSSKNKKLVNLSATGLLIKSLEDLFQILTSNGGVCTIAKTHGEYSFVWDDAIVDVSYNEKSHDISISGLTLNPKLSLMMEIIKSDFITKVKKNLVFTIVQNTGGLDIRNMGDGSSPLITGNYHPEVLEEVDFVLRSFKKTPPAGRICILNGEPGTGKTHLIRSMLTQLDCVFLIVPSGLIDALDKPAFLPLLLDIKDKHEKPIIMVIEDGDVCLVPRKNDNISTIASLLNLSDGILGSMIDIKMIISTNANIGEMDAAIMRPGRLCRNIHVGPLPYEQANQVYRRLMKDESVHLEQKRHYTLAEIYDRFNNLDTLPVPNTKRVIGFATPVKNDDNRMMNKGRIGF